MYLKYLFSGSIIKSPAIVEPKGKSTFPDSPLIRAVPKYNPLSSCPATCNVSAMCACFHLCVASPNT